MQRPVPVPAEGQVLIRISACGVNRPDILQARGLYPPSPGATDVLGLEASGMVIETGAAVQRWQIGDKVTALLDGGGYADYVMADEGLCLPVSAALSLQQAAALPEALATLHSNLHGHIPPGSAVLVHGGSGGLGHLALQLCKQVYGAFVFTTARAAKAAFCKAQGADVVIDYQQDDFAEAIRSHPQHGRVALVLDVVGGDYSAKNLAVLAPRGRLVQLAFQQGSRIRIDMLPLMLKQLVWTGSTLRSRPLEQKRAIIRTVERDYWPLVEQGILRPCIQQTFALDDAQQAHAWLDSGQHCGKTVLLPSGTGQEPNH